MGAERLGDLARSVAGRLRRNPKVQIVNGVGVELFVYQGFLDRYECGGLIAMIDADRVPSTLYAVDGTDNEFRTSESCNLDRHHPFVHTIDEKIDTLLGLKHKQGESLQGQRYAIGQQFKAHTDYFHPGTQYYEKEMAQGGQRCWTAMIYLDEPDEGGETQFTNAGLTVTPRAGMLLAWCQTDEQGAPAIATLHASLPVRRGIKNIVTKWYRERFWQPASA